MRNNTKDNRNEHYNEREPRWLHEQEHGENSRRGNYRIDSHFNRGYGVQEDDYRDDTSFNTNTDQGFGSREGRYQAGGANYMGQDFTRNRNSDNPYGMTYTSNDGYNSGRHYDARADYNDRDYDSFRNNKSPRERFSMTDERFGHDVSRGRVNQEEYMGRYSRGDHESYRRYEQSDRRYDNDYSGGFAGRNYTEGQDHYGEDRHYSDQDKWNDGENQRKNRQ